MKRLPEDRFDRPCVTCGLVFRPKHRVVITCSKECLSKRRKSRGAVVRANCYVCKAPIVATKKQRDQLRATGRVYCGIVCSNKFKASVTGPRIAAFNRAHAGARMRANNPMKSAAAREKMKASLAARGHRPLTRGGNGRPPPEPQRRLAEALGWEMEFVVKTRKRREDGWPYHYKLDIANPAAMVCVEVDGRSHGPIARREQDARKDELLRSRGWTVLRFSNEQVTTDLERCVRTVLSTISK